MNDISSAVVCGGAEFVSGVGRHFPDASPLASFTSAQECARSLPTLMESGARTLVIGSGVLDVTPLNFAGSAAESHPSLEVVLVGDFDTRKIPDEFDIQTASSLDAYVTSSTGRRGIQLPPVAARPDEAGRAPVALGKVIVLASARGGVGKTTIACLSAMLAARAGIETAVLDLDLQFGDVAFTFDRMPERTLLQISEDLTEPKAEVNRLGERLEKNLSIFVPSGKPEHAELVAPRIGGVLHSLRRAFQLVVIDTGAFWTLLHAEVLEAADLCLMVLGPRAASVRANSQARELCSKLGIPDAKLMHVMSRVTDDGEASPMDAAANLRIPEVIAVPDGGSEVSALMGIGHPEGLLDSSNPAAASVAELLERILPALGMSYTSSLKRPFGSRRKRRW